MTEKLNILEKWRKEEYNKQDSKKPVAFGLEKRKVDQMEFHFSPL